MDENDLARTIIGAAIEVHRTLGPGMLESTYQECLARELDLSGITYSRELPVSLDYKGMEIEQAYRLDFLVNDLVVVELKSVQSVEPVHKAQLLTYLKWSKKRLGLLLNFNVPVLRSGIHRVVNKLG
ncbi:MAG: GxxExxY protein [Gammaproteobacteria bacterium]|jgi:GxxExxY protein